MMQTLIQTNSGDPTNKRNKKKLEENEERIQSIVEKWDSKTNDIFDNMDNLQRNFV